MSREIDERIVAMYFDNKNFERNAEKTIKTLEELKQSANMEGVGKGFEAFEQAKNKMNFDKLNDSAKKLKTSLSSVSDVMKKGMTQALNPLNMLKRGFDELNGYVTKVAGINIASKIVSGVENALRSLTVAPVSAGWNQYNSTMDSIKTIMSSTGEDIDTVKQKLAEMTEYANLTIYSLTDMTSNLGKFTNNGVKLNDATQAMIGLANATADAGQGAAQASMAMYNVSQAIGVGKMTTIDWKSLENANIATVQLKKTFMQAAVASGDLVKKTVKIKDASTGAMKEVEQYWTKAEKGSKAMEVTTENFRETLSKGWLTKDAMLTTFQIYSGLDWKEIKKLGDFTDAEAQALELLGQKAKQAATEVRTFPKMMDALRESVQSGWAKSFEFIFGDMQEGTNLWTTLNNKIDEILTKGTESRNGILMAWRGLMKDENGNVKKVQDLYEFRKNALENDLLKGYIDLETYERKMKKLNEELGNKDLWVDYRETAVKSFFELFDVIKEIGSAVKAAWTDVFGEFDANSLRNLTKGFRDFVNRIKEWLGSLTDGESRISKIRKGLTGVFNVAKIGLNIFKTMLTAAWKVVKPLIDPLLSLFAAFGSFMNMDGAKNLGEMLTRLGDRFKNLWDRITKLGWKGAFEKIGTWVSGLWTNIKTGVTTWLTDNGLDGVVEWFHGIADKIKEGWEAVKGWWNKDGNVVRETFQNIYNAVAGVFTKKTVVGKQGNTWEEEMPFIQFFTDLWDWISTTATNIATDIDKWWNGENNVIRTTIEDAWSWISGLFTPENENGGFADTPIAKFFTGILNWITGTWEDIKTKVTEWWSNEDNPIKNAFQSAIDWVAGLFQGGMVVGKQGNTWYTNPPIIQFFIDIWEWIEGTWNDISSKVSEWWNGGENPVKKALDDAWNWVTGLFKSEDDKEGEKLPIVKFFESIPGKLEAAWKQVTEWFEKSGIADFFRDAWGWIKENVLGIKDSDGNGDVKGSAKPVYDEDFIKAMTIAGAGVMPQASQGAKDAMNAWRNGTKSSDKPLTDEEIKRVPVLDFLQRIYETLVGVWDDIYNWTGWQAIGTFLSDTFKWVSEIFKKTDTGSTENPEKQRTLIDSIGEFLKGVIEAIADVVRSAASSELGVSVVNSLKDIIKVVANIVEIITGFLSRLTEGIKEGNIFGKLTQADKIISITAVAGYLITTLLSILKAKALSNLASSGGVLTNFGDQILKFSAGIMLIAAAIKYLGTLPTEQLLQGGASLLVIGGIITTILVTINRINATINKRTAPETVGERIAKHAITAVTIAGTIAEVMALLPNILDKLKNFDEHTNGDAIFKTFTSIGLMISSIILSIAIFNKLGGGQGSVAMAAKGALSIVAGLAILLVGMDAIFGVILGIDELGDQLGAGSNGQLLENHVKRIKAGAEVLTALGEAIGSFLGAIGGGVAGGFSRAQGNQLAHGAKDASAILADVKVEDMEHMAEVVGVLSDIQEALPDYDNIWDKWINGDKLGILGDNVGRLGKGLGEMVAAVNPATIDTDFKDIDRLKTYVLMLGNFANVLNVLYKSVDQAVSWSAAYYTPGQIEGILNNTLPYYREAAASLAKAINEGLGGEDAALSFQINFDTTQIVAAICRSLEQTGSEKISIAVRKMINEGLSGYAGTTGKELHSSGQINEALTNIFDAYTTGNMPGLDLGSILSGVLGDMGNEETLNAFLTKYDGAFGTFGDAISDKMNESIHFDLDKWLETDENGNIPALANMETQWNEALAKFEEAGGANFELKIRPVITMDGFGEEYGKISKFVSGQAPLEINANMAFGENQRLPIDDVRIVDSIQAIRQEMVMTRIGVASAINMVNNSLGNRISSLGDSISRMKFVLDTGILVGAVDRGLYDRGMIGAQTGVYPSFGRP